MRKTIGLVSVLAAVTAAADFDKAAEWARWQEFAAKYEGDFSDSSEYLAPPKEGRLAKPVRLAENGEARAEIVVDLSEAIRIENFYPDPAKRPLALRWQMGHETECARTAAFELKKLLKLVTGAEFPVLAAPGDTKRPRIFLGAPSAAKHFPEDIKALASSPAFDGYAVREKDGDIYIFGVTPAGTLYGAIRFVENNTDLIFAAPGNAGIVCTKTPTLDAGWGDAREIPVFRVRGYQGGDREWKMRNGLNFRETGAEGLGFFALHGGHYLCPQYYDYATGLRKWNSMNAKGERSKNWDETRDHACLADPEFLPHAIETVPGIGTFMYSMPHVTVIGMDDNASVCHCPKCTAPIKAADGTELTPEKDKEDYWCAWFYRYLNQVDDEIQKRCPGYVTSTFAYFFARTFPKIPVNRTIIPWQCTYGRSNYRHPVFAPEHAIWQRCYEGWAAHTGELMLYDYYGLCIVGQPYAEVYQRELLYQRSLGFLSTSTEGFMTGDDLGTIDDRWCMARLAWNPDADVEQLHRRYTRRAYREAAPHMHRLRCLVRKAFFAAETEGLKEAVQKAGIAPAIQAELEKAQAAVKHPAAARLVARAATAWGELLGFGGRSADERAFERILAVRDNKWSRRQTEDGDPCFVFNLVNGIAPGIALPAGLFKGKLAVAQLLARPGYFETCGSPVPAVAQTEKGRFDECEYSARPAGENRLEITFRIPEGSSPVVLSFCPDRAKSGWTPPEKSVQLVDLKLEPDDGRMLGEIARHPKPSAAKVQEWRRFYANLRKASSIENTDFDNPLEPLEKRRASLIEKIVSDIGSGATASAADALAFFRAHVADAPAKAWGYSGYMRREGGEAIGRFASAFAQKGLFAEAAAVYSAWETWDGEKTPFDIRWERRRAKRRFFSGLKQKAAKDVKAEVEREHAAMLARAVTEASKAADRAAAKLELASMQGKNLRDEVLAVMNDEYASCNVRADAAKLLPKAFTENGRTDWAGAEKALVDALVADDWSSLTRSCYSRQSTRDLQLESLLALVEAERAAGQEARAKDLLEKGAKALRYDREPRVILEEELKTIPGNFTKPVIADVRSRLAPLQKLRNQFDRPKAVLEESDTDTLTLDE